MCYAKREEYSRYAKERHPFLLPVVLHRFFNHHSLLNRAASLLVDRVDVPRCAVISIPSCCRYIISAIQGSDVSVQLERRAVGLGARFRDVGPILTSCSVSMALEGVGGTPLNIDAHMAEAVGSSLKYISCTDSPRSLPTISGRMLWERTGFIYQH